jgi:predicted nucleic acid-binding protein
VTERVVCLDTSIYIKLLTPDEQHEAVTLQVQEVLASDAALVAPAFAWAEVGSVLRKKVRQQLLRHDEAEELWSAFLELPVDYADSAVMRRRSWEIAQQYRFPTLYDAAFLACAEMAGEGQGEFWTADEELIRLLGESTPENVHLLPP